MTKYYYTYTSHEDETELCAMELQALLGCPIVARKGSVLVEQQHPVSVHRSPFVKRRVDILIQAPDLTNLIQQVKMLGSIEGTFKVMYTDGDNYHSYDEQRQLEREVGSAVCGQPDMRKPTIRFGVVPFQGGYMFGPCFDNEGHWFKHQKKPQNYSTALPAKVARAIVNIAVGIRSEEYTMIDPCCGMGTVLIEARSMGITSEGMDINPLAVQGARKNLQHFGYTDIVRLGDMLCIEQQYDVAIVDLPYNLCSVLPTSDLHNMLRVIKRICNRAVIVSTMNMNESFQHIGLRLVEQATHRKGSFTRIISVVE